MDPIRPPIALALAVATCGSARAQTLVVTDLAQGATACFELTGANTSAVAVFVVGFGGVNTGLPLDSNALYFMKEPTIIPAIVFVAADGSASFEAQIPASMDLVAVAAQVVELFVVDDVLDVETSNFVEATIAPISALGEDFDSGVASDAWRVHQAALGSADIVGGELVLAPSVGGLPNMWFEDGEGLAFVRRVTGDFDVTCAVRVHAPGALGSPPPTGYQLGGLIVRDRTNTAPGTHEWCHVATGSGGPGEFMGVEWKETHASSSAWAVSPASSTYRELRLLRRGEVVTAYHRDSGALDWIELATYNFTALPSTVEVGAMAYAFVSPAEVVARFDWIAFAP